MNVKPGLYITLFVTGCFSTGMVSAQGEAGDGQGNRAPMPMATTYEITAQIDAGADVFAEWPGAKETWHHGVGFLDPFGKVEYFCGKNFPEVKDHPLEDWVTGLFENLTGRPDPLFCVYRTAEGDFYVYDSVPGTLMRGEDYGRDLILNVVIDGSGPYKGATGIWIGRTQGVEPRVQVSETRQGPKTLLKIMRGYVKIPE